MNYSSQLSIGNYLIAVSLKKNMKTHKSLSELFVWIQWNPIPNWFVLQFTILCSRSKAGLQQVCHSWQQTDWIEYVYVPAFAIYGGTIASLNDRSDHMLPCLFIATLLLQPLTLTRFLRQCIGTLRSYLNFVSLRIFLHASLVSAWAWRFVISIFIWISSFKFYEKFL